MHVWMDYDGCYTPHETPRVMGYLPVGARVLVRAVVECSNGSTKVLIQSACRDGVVGPEWADGGGDQVGDFDPLTWQFAYERCPSGWDRDKDPLEGR